MRSSIRKREKNMRAPLLWHAGDIFACRGQPTDLMDFSTSQRLWWASRFRAIARAVTPHIYNRSCEALTVREGPK